jgi:hypothetical protein
MMKRFLILLFAVFTASAAFAQYPNAPNKMRLGAQTTGNGLIFRHAGEPSWTPTGLNNAWLSIDTLTGDLYAYRDGNWFLEIKGDLQQVYPLVINKTGSPILRGQVVGVDTSQIVQGDQIRIMPAIGDGGLSSKLIMGVAANDIANDSSGYVAWFGYVREVDETDIAQTGITLNVGDILYLSATEPGRLTNVEPTPPALKTTIALVVRKPTANNMTLLVRPKLNEDLSDLNDVDLNGINNGQTIVWDSINTKWIAGDVGSAIDTTTIATKFYVDSKVDSTRLVSDSILVYYIGGVELRRDTLSLPPAGVTSITAGVGLTGGTITSTGTIAADTAGVLVTKTFLTNQGYTTNTGTVTGTGANGRVSFWTGTNSQGSDSGLFWDNTNKRLGVGTISPNFRLEVNGSTRLDGNFTTINSNPSFYSSGNPARRFTYNLIDGNLAKFYYFDEIAATFHSIEIGGSASSGVGMTITGTGSVGINTTTPSVRLDVAGTDGIRIPTGTTAERPGTPLVGMMRNNTSNNNLDFYTGTAWENYLKSATATGLGTAGRVFYADANGRATGSSKFTVDETNSQALFSDGNAINTNLNTSATSMIIARNNGTQLRVIASSDAAGPDSYAIFNGIRSRGSITSPTPVLLNDFITGFVGNAFNGTPTGGATAGIFLIADADATPTAAPQKITFLTSELLNANRVERMVIKPNGRIGVGTSTPARLLHINGEVRITDLTTDPPTRIVGADADGDLGQIRIGTGLTLSGDTLNVTAAGSTNLTFSGASSPVTLNSDTGTDVTFTAGDGISFSQTSNNLTISKASPIYAVITVDSNRTSTFLAASVTPDTIDNPKLSQVGGVFSVVGNGIQYTSGTSRTFLITANADFKFSEANNVVKFQGWRSNGGTVIDLGTFGTVESLLGNEIMHTSFSAITSLSNNDLLRFGFTPGAHTGDDDLVLTNLSITITQL